MSRIKKNETRILTTKGWFRCENVPAFTIKTHDFMIAFSDNKIIGSYCAFTELSEDSKNALFNLRNALDKLLTDYDNIVKLCNID